MEQAQLFKRLLAMTEDEISSFVKHDDEIGKSLIKLDLAARTRHIINAVQLEDMWQQLNDETQTFNIHIAMRLSPAILCSCLDFEEDMNCLEWRLVLPKPSGKFNAMPSKFELSVKVGASVFFGRFSLT